MTRLFKLEILIFLLLIISTASTRADECPESECQEPSRLIEAYRCLTHKTGVVDENGRRTEEEFAAEKLKPLTAVQNRFAPTGILKCDGSELTAQLTGSTGVITTAGHGFMDMEKCKAIADPKSCVFTVKIGKSERVSKVSGMQGTGVECPNKNRAIDDWAVLKIDPPLEGITPYDIPESLDIKEGQDVLAVSAQARDFYRIDPKTKKKYLPKSIEECQTKQTHGIQRTSLVESNCDFGRGASGGSLLRVVNGRDTLIGISIANRESETALRQAERRGTPNTGVYQPDKWTTFHVPLNAKFLETVKKAMLDQSI